MSVFHIKPARRMPKPNQSVRLIERQRLQQDGIDHAEDRCVGPENSEALLFFESGKSISLGLADSTLLLHYAKFTNALPSARDR
jgi:hypothetical protein